MSDTTNDNGQVVDRRRVLVSLAAALALHGALLIAFALGLGSGGAPVQPPVTIDLQAPTGLGSETAAATGGSSAGAAAAQPGAAPAGAASAGAAQAQVAVPAAGKSPAPSAALPSASTQGSGGFVIPTPRAQPAQAAPSSGSAFRESGGRTGVASGIPSVPGPSTGPTVAPVQQGSGSGASSSSGAGESAAQRSGTAVLVPGPSGAASGPLDLGKLDKALASGGGGKGAPRSGGTGSPATTGSGGGSGSGGAAGTGGGGAGQGINVGWGSSDAGRGRTLVFSVKPKIPRSVSQQGLMLSVKVRFTVLPHGEISAVAIEKSSGYAEVDASVIEAIHMWLFNSVPGAAPAEGTISYQIDTR